MTARHATTPPMAIQGNARFVADPVTGAVGSSVPAADGAPAARGSGDPHFAHIVRVDGLTSPQFVHFTSRPAASRCISRPACLSRLALLQVRAALRADRGRGGIPRPAESAMDVRARACDLRHVFILDQLRFRGRVKLHVLRLGRAAILASLLRSRVAAVAIRADPFELDEAFGLFGSCY